MVLLYERMRCEVRIGRNPLATVSAWLLRGCPMATEPSSAKARRAGLQTARMDSPSAHLAAS